MIHCKRYHGGLALAAADVAGEFFFTVGAKQPNMVALLERDCRIVIHTAVKRANIDLSTLFPMLHNELDSGLVVNGAVRIHQGSTAVRTFHIEGDTLIHTILFC